MKKIIISFLFVIIVFSAGCKEKVYAPTVMNSVKADSILEGNAKSYGPDNLFDQTGKSWCEGAKDDGIGSKITITLANESKIETIYIKNGFGDTEYFLPNNRVKEMGISGEKGKNTVTLADTQEMQEVKLKNPVIGRFIELEILSVYKGSKFTDTCIAEVSFKNIKIPSCEKVGDFKTDFKTMEISFNRAMHMILSGDGSLKGQLVTQNPLNIDGTWTKHGNKVFLDFEMDEEVGTGCGSLRPEDRKGCSRIKKQHKIVLTVLNSCTIQSSDGNEVEIRKIEK